MLPEKEINEIRAYLDTKFEHALFDATLRQVTRKSDPLRANNFAYALRELSRHILARLSPDEEIESAPWFVQVQNDRGIDIITRAQRIKFAIQGHLEDTFLAQTLEVDYQAETRTLREAIDSLSKYTHVEPATFGIPENQVAELCSGALAALADMFRSMFDCRERTLQSVAEHIDETVVSHVVEETLEGFYDFATHYAVEDVVVENIVCDGFRGDEIFGTVEGTVSVTLQYGSSGDRERGDGMETDASADFTCEVCVAASNLTDVSILDGTFEMDYEELRQSWGDDDSEEDVL